ncbi:MAG: hypothetical protein ACOYMA_02515 [Bacteroidia bacterium]
MKKNIFLLIIIGLSFSAIAQRTNYMLLRNLENGKHFKLMYDLKYAVKLKPDFISTLPQLLKELHVQNDHIILKLDNANYDTLFFKDGLAIPYRFIESMSGRDVSYYSKVGILGIDLAILGLTNYLMMQDNSSIYGVVFINLFTGIAPIALALPLSMANDYVVLNKYGIESLENKDIFKRKTKTIFDK